MRLLGALQLGLKALLAPQTCGMCDRWVLNHRLIPLCDTCRAGLIRITGPVCHYCGTPLPGSLLENLARCSSCRDHPPVPLIRRSWGLYEGDLRELIHLYKFQPLKRLAWPLSQMLFQGLEAGFSDLQFDWIVPVPSHPARVRERGFDAVGLLAKRLSEQTGIPVCSGVSRSRRTAPQLGLGRVERALNVKGAFHIRDGRIRVRGSLLIVDDILTTGTTVFELASALQRQGRVEHMAALTIARTPLWAGSRQSISS